MYKGTVRVGLKAWFGLLELAREGKTITGICYQLFDYDYHDAPERVKEYMQILQNSAVRVLNPDRLAGARTMRVNRQDWIDLLDLAGDFRTVSNACYQLLDNGYSDAKERVKEFLKLLKEHADDFLKGQF